MTFVLLNLMIFLMHLVVDVALGTALGSVNYNCVPVQPLFPVSTHSRGAVEASATYVNYSSTDVSRNISVISLFHYCSQIRCSPH